MGPVTERLSLGARAPSKRRRRVIGPVTQVTGPLQNVQSRLLLSASYSGFRFPLLARRSWRMDAVMGAPPAALALGRATSIGNQEPDARTASVAP